MSVEASTSARKQLARLSERLRSATTEVVWAQWSAIGTTATGRKRARSIVDPEALVLVSLGPALDERRIRDLVSDWATLNSSLLSVQRIKNLAGEGKKDAHDRLATFARIVVDHGKDFRWRSLAATTKRDKGSPPRRSNKARAVSVPNLGHAAMWLTLRLVLGVGIKADTLAFLLGIGGPASARAISAATSYTVAAVGRSLDDLVAARLVLVVDTPHEAKQYRARADAWNKLLDIDSPMPPWRDWHQRFAFVDDFLVWSNVARERTVSRDAFGIKGRELMKAHWAVFASVEVAGLDNRREMSDQAEYVERSVHALAARMEAEI